MDILGEMSSRQIASLEFRGEVEDGDVSGGVSLCTGFAAVKLEEVKESQCR